MYSMTMQMLCTTPHSGSESDVGPQSRPAVEVGFRQAVQTLLVMTIIVDSSATMQSLKKSKLDAEEPY